MKRKKLSPALVISWLAVAALVSYAALLYTTGIGSQRVHGASIKDDVIAISELTERASSELEKEAPSPAKLAYIAGELAAREDGAGINEHFMALRDKAAAALNAYAEALEAGGYSDSAVAILREDAVNTASRLHKAAQYIMEYLYSPSEKKMNSNFFDARVVTSRKYRQISAYVKSLGSE